MLGLPFEQWDLLIEEAKDILHDEDLGTHIVAAFPSGHRIYGIESAPMALFCIYLDPVEALLDPCPGLGDATYFRDFKVGNIQNNIRMVSFHKWVQSLQHKLTWWNHVVPSYDRFFFIDDDIYDLVENLITPFIIDKWAHSNCFINGFNDKSYYGNEIFDEISGFGSIHSLVAEILKLRCAYITLKSKKFNPTLPGCFDAETDKLSNYEELPAKFFILDELLCDYAKNNNCLELNNNRFLLLEFTQFVLSEFKQIKMSTTEEHVLDNSLYEIRKEVISFYKFCL